MSERRADAIILAGGTIRSPELREKVGTDCRALIDLHGKPMVQWTAEAVKAAPAIGRVVIVGRPALRESPAASVVDGVVDEGKDEVDNLFRGLEALPGAEWVYMVSADLPLLTGEAVDDLLAHAPEEADVVFPVCERADIVRDFPHREWTFVKMPDGAFTGASGFLFRPGPITEQRAWLQEVLDARRHVLKLINMWGLVFGIKAMLHLVTLAEAEAHISEVLGLRGRAYVSRFTEMCMDVDYPPDVDLVLERLAARGQ